MRYVRDICAETWPGLAAANAAAYEQWRARYGPFLREIERAHDDRLRQERRRDPAGHAELARRWEESDLRFRDTLAAQLLIDGLESFEGECRTYPAYLASPRADLEKVFAERVATIRRGRPKGVR